MHPLLALTLGMFSAVTLVRWCAKEVRRVNSEFERMRAHAAVEPIDRTALPTLKRDPVTGEYRPG